MIVRSYMSVEDCNQKCVEALLTHKDISIHIKDEQGRTPLEIALLLIHVASDEMYSGYKPKFESIVTLLQGYPFSEHQLIFY